MATVQALLRCALSEDRGLLSQDPTREAEILLGHCLEKDRAWLYTWPEKDVPEDIAQRYLQLLAARREGRPVAHLTGRREFWSLDLDVNEHTLIPRAETETLVEWALDLDLPAGASVLDLGTGSGAIALALAQERPQWHVSAVDVSVEALAVAKSNAVRLNLERVNFAPSNWYEAVAGTTNHLIVSNPPYIEAGDEHLVQGDLPFEPPGALVAGDNGLADLVSIVAGAPDYLHPAGWLLLEHGYNQGQAVRALLQGHGFHNVVTRRDLDGNDRITGGQWHVE